MEKDIEEIVQCYDRFVDIVKEISMNAKEQIIKLKGTKIWSRKCYLGKCLYSRHYRYAK